ncbi:MAG: bifunctional folylpolyglutamate synthase/dihydrofolate synthase [Lachnospiraceae bacterium]|nr:bifunctional folylpolyglutamate synthase/dihydrofolate synthase [Lachnospiraceae bacterium]
MNETYDASAYEKAEAYIYNIPKFTKKNDLNHTKRLLAELGSPALHKKIIHVAGTNGKGSVCAYLNSFLLSDGKRVGMFTSPHLISMNERIRINGEIVTREEFLSGFEKVKSLIDKLSKETAHPTFFEMLFLIAMCIFEKNRVEYVILETGLGGRLDATNVIEKPIVTVITRIGLDHCQYLGATKPEIAGEKAGILKEGAPVVYLKKYRDTARIVEKRAWKMGCPMEGLEEDSYIIKNFKNKSIDFSYKSRYYDYVTFIVPACALYQVENISLALRAYECIRTGEQIHMERLQEAVLHTRWEGRMEEAAEGIYVDGAHNEDGMLAFLDTVGRMSCTGKRILLFSVVSDKDYRSMIKALTDTRLFQKIIVVSMKDKRGLSLEELKKNFSVCREADIRFFPTVEEGMHHALLEKGKEDMVFAAGSLYLAGDVLSLLRQEEVK